jgi:hypothetical protein
MKVNQNYIIGAAAVLGGGLYFAYKKGLFGKKEAVSPVAETKIESKATINDIKQEQKAVAKDNVKKAVVRAAVSVVTNITNANSYKGKVSQIQSNLGVAVDGIAGTQTNMAYNAKYGLDKGAISEANVDFYLDKVKNNLTLAKQAILSKQTTGTAIVNALRNGGTIRFLNTINAQNFVLNKATNSYSAIGTRLLFNQGTILGSGWKAIDRGAGLVLIYKGTTLQQVPVNAIAVI